MAKAQAPNLIDGITEKHGFGRTPIFWETFCLMKQSKAVRKIVTEHSLTGASVRPRLHSTDDILVVAKKCILLHGPHVPTALIAHQAGVSQATLFKRFGTKDNLIKHALKNDMVFGWVEQLEAGPNTGESIRAQLTGLAETLITFYLEHLHSVLAWRAANQWPKAMDKPQNVANLPIPTRARKALTSWLLEAQKQGRLGRFDAESMAIFYIAGCQAPAFRAYMSGETIDLDQYSDTFVRSFWLGVAP